MTATMKASRWTSSRATWEYGPMRSGPCSWDVFLQLEGTMEDEAVRNPKIRAWVLKHHRGHFVPTEVLRAMNLEPPP